MKMGWKSTIVAGTILLAGGLTWAGLGAGRSAGSPMMGNGLGHRAAASAGQRHPFRWIAWWLDLTPKQITQVQDILQQAKPDAQAAAVATASARRALHDAVIGDATNLKIRAAAAVLGQAIGTEAVLRAKTLASVKGVLTAEQQKEFDKILTKLPGLRLRMQGRLGILAGEPNEPAQAAPVTP
jgi:Spy/CpxP family protein refolding chaperone